MQKFLRDDARRYVEKGYANVYVWPDPADPCHVMGYYTLSASNVAKEHLANRHERKAEKGIPVPVALIGYMGKTDGAPQGFGGVLIVDAAIRVAQDTGGIAAWGLALEPENDQLVAWYEKQNFTRAKNRPGFMYGSLQDFLPK